MRTHLQLILGFILMFVFISSCGEANEPELDNKIEILFLGDTGFGEGYQAKRAKKGQEHILNSRGYASAFELLKPLCLRSKTTVLNLETPLFTPSQNTTYNTQKKYIHWSDALKSAEVFKQLQIEAVSLGNNHILDYGIEGLNSTMKTLTDHEIAFFGAGLNQVQAEQAYHVHTFSNETKRNIYVINGFHYVLSYDSIYDFYAGENKAGVNKLDINRLSEQIRDIKKNDRNAFVIFYPHWGQNYSWKSRTQTEMAHRIIDADADLIIGHGAHCCQEIEQYQGKWIIYNIGNFVFNSPGRYNKVKTLANSFAVAVNFKNKEAQIDIYPILSDNRVTDYRPRQLNHKETVKMFAKVSKKSALPKEKFTINENRISLIN